MFNYGKKVKRDTIELYGRTVDFNNRTNGDVIKTKSFNGTKNRIINGISRKTGRQIGNYIRCNTITPDGSTTTFALTNVLDNTAVVPGTENNVLCSLSGVIQAPGSGNAFTISGSNIVFDSAPSSSDVVDFIIVLGNTIDIGTPSDGTVGMNQLSASGTKDATTFLRGDNSFQVVVQIFTDVVGDTSPQLGGDLDALIL